MAKEWRENQTPRKTAKGQVVGSLLKGTGDVQGVLVLGEGVAILVKTGGPGSELPLFPILPLLLLNDYKQALAGH